MDNSPADPEANPEDTPRTGSRRRLIGILGGGLLFGLAGVLVGRLLDRPLPALVTDLPTDPIPRNRMLAHRVDEYFPQGSPETALIAALEQQGFAITPAIGRASWNRFRPPCREFVDLNWRARAGRIVSIDAMIYQVC